MSYLSNIYLDQTHLASIETSTSRAHHICNKTQNGFEIKTFSKSISITVCSAVFYHRMLRAMVTLFLNFTDSDSYWSVRAHELILQRFWCCGHCNILHDDKHCSYCYYNSCTAGVTLLTCGWTHCRDQTLFQAEIKFMK